MKKTNSFKFDESDDLADKIISCRRCPRLVKHCLAVAQKKIMKRAAYVDDIYWGRPVPNFGKSPASLLIVGLAPGAHGANRTSRMFTGDDSGLWLYRALHRAGFAQTANASHVGDNRLIDTMITAVAHCAPPGNKLEPEEIKNCRPFLLETIKRAKPKVILALGQIAWTSSLSAVENLYGASLGSGKTRPAFKHGAVLLKDEQKSLPISLIASFHVSRQNTNTGRLTEPMLDEIFKTARRLVN